MINNTYLALETLVLNIVKVNAWYYKVFFISTKF